MAIQYDFLKRPGSPSKEGTDAKLLHPKVVMSSYVSFRKLAEDISASTSFKVPDLVGIMEAIATAAAQHLNNGSHVELAGLGTLSLGITCDRDAEGHLPEITSPSEVKPHQLHVSKVILTAKPEFMDRLQGPFIRAKEGFPSNAKRERLDPEARRTALLAYLEVNPSINIRQYVSLTGLTEKKASRELHDFANPESADPILNTANTSTHRVFVLKK